MRMECLYFVWALLSKFRVLLLHQRPVGPVAHNADADADADAGMVTVGFIFSTLDFENFNGLIYARDAAYRA